VTTQIMGEHKMLTQNVTKTESVENISEGTFVYCAELRSGFIKQGLGVLNITDWTFQNVLNQIKLSALETMENNDLDAVLFGANLTPIQGQLEESDRLTKQIQRYVTTNQLNGGTMISHFNAKKATSKYFNNENIIEYEIVGNLKIDKFVNDGDIDISGYGVTSPRCFEFGNNGRKLYIVGTYGSGGSDTIVEIDLSIPYDITSGGSVVNSFNMDTYRSITVYSMKLSSDGSKLYINGGAEYFEQFNLDNAWSLSSFTHQTQEEKAKSSTGADIVSVYAFDFSENGDYVYLVSGTHNEILKYSLSTPWDTMTMDINPVDYFDYSSIETSIVENGLTFSSNGEYMLISGNTSDTISSIKLSTPWDLSSIDTNSTKSLNKTVFSNTDPRSLNLMNDNKTIYVLRGSSTNVQKLILDETPRLTDYTVSSEFYHGHGYSEDVTFSDDGSRMYITAYSGDKIYQYLLSTPWDITTATQEYLYLTTGIEATPRALAFSANGSKAYVSGGSEDGGILSLTTPWDLSTASLEIPMVDHLLNSDGTLNTSIEGAWLNNEGTRLFIITNAGYISEYTADTPFYFNQTPINEVNVEAIDATANSLSFNSDLSIIYWVGSSADKVFEMNLTTSGDISTIDTENYDSMVIVDPVANPTGIYYNSERDELFFNDYSSNKVYKFTR
jgi:6-phosphogluconolactonase (cycloisomerase 2 family)